MAATEQANNDNGGELSHLVARARKFSLQLPVVGKVAVPPPDELAFFGALGLLAAVSVIDWPVAVAIGAGQYVMARHMRENDQAQHDGRADKSTPPRKSTQPRKTTPTRKTTSRKPTKAARS